MNSGSKEKTCLAKIKHFLVAGELTITPKGQVIPKENKLYVPEFPSDKKTLELRSVIISRYQHKGFYCNFLILCQA